MSSIAQHDSSAAGRGFTLRHFTLILLIAGLIITGYLSYTHLTETSVVCVESGAFNCDTVNSSIYSQFMGIPIAYLGFLADLFMFLVVLLEPRIALLENYSVMIVFGISLLGFIYHGYLTYVSVTRINALCIWCLSAHVVMTLVLIVTGIRLYRQLFPGEDAT